MPIYGYDAPYHIAKSQSRPTPRAVRRRAGRGHGETGVRHIAPRKEPHYDSDTWLLLVAEDYDRQNTPWKVGEVFAAPIWKIGGVCDVEPFAKYDLLNGRYVVDQGPIGWARHSLFHAVHRLSPDGQLLFVRAAPLDQ